MKKILFVCLATAMLTACPSKNGSSGPDAADVAEAAKDPKLQGKVFVGECSTKIADAIVTGILTGGEASIKSQQVALHIAGANVTRVARLYTTPNCQGEAALYFEEAGKMKINKNQRTNDGGTAIDLELRRLTAKVGSPDGAKIANAVRLCGANDWKSKMNRDVTSKSKEANCYGTSLPRKVHTVYKLEGKALSLGSVIRVSNNENERPVKVEGGDKLSAQ